MICNVTGLRRKYSDCLLYSAEVSVRHFGHAEMSWVRTSVGPKCLGYEVFVHPVDMAATASFNEN